MTVQTFWMTLQAVTGIAAEAPTARMVTREDESWATCAHARPASCTRFNIISLGSTICLFKKPNTTEREDRIRVRFAHLVAHCQLETASSLKRLHKGLELVPERGGAAPGELVQK